MSHYTKVRTRLTDAETLVSALGRVGFPIVENHDEPQPLFGYQGDARPERAEVIVRRVHVGEHSNDIGFVQQSDDTFEAIISEFDQRHYDEAWLGRLTQQYGYVEAVHYADRYGYEIAEETSEADGTIRLALRRP